MAYLTIGHVLEQEIAVQEATLQNLGALLELHQRAINCLIRAVYWLPVLDQTDEGEYKAQVRLWLHSATHSFRAAQLLAMSGYYLDAEVIGRHLVEILVKMRYFQQHPGELKDFSLLTTKKPAPVSFKAMFDEVMPGFYEEYKYSLSYPAHGGAPQVYRMQTDLSGSRALDTGVAYKEFWATAFVNWHSVLLLGFLHTYQRIFPELFAALTTAEQQELRAVESALEDVIKSHIAFKGGENSWHKATRSIWDW